MEDPLSTSVTVEATRPESIWQTKHSGLYSRLRDPNEKLGLDMDHIHHIRKIMPHSSLNLKRRAPAKIGETSALILRESPEDLGRNDQIGHAVLVTINKKAPENYYVELFDSTNKEISKAVKQCLIQILPANSQVCVHHVPVQDQGQTMDCAYYVLAFLAHLCLGLRQELDTVVFDASKMRRHLDFCCRMDFVTEFPTVKDENNLKLSDHERTSIPDHSWYMKGNVHNPPTSTHKEPPFPNWTVTKSFVFFK